MSMLSTHPKNVSKFSGFIDMTCGVCGTADWIPAFAGMTGFGGKVFPSFRHSRAGGSPWGGGRGRWFCYPAICHLA